MKRKLLFLSLLMVFALVLFAGCDGILGGGKGGELTGVASFEVKDDSNEEMTYSDKSDDALLKVFVAAGMAEEGDDVSKYEAMFDGVKEYLNQAKISEKQIVALGELIEENSDLIEFFMTQMNNEEGEEPDITADLLKKLLEFYKGAIGIVGNDAAGKLAYQLALKDAEGDAEAIASLEAVGYENFVVTSRMVFAIVNSVIWSISNDDIDVIVPIATSDEEPTNAEILKLIAIVIDALDAINLKDDVWNQYFELILAKYDDVVASVEAGADVQEGEEVAPAEAIDTGKAVLAFIGKYMNTNIKFLKEILRQIDAEFIELASADTNVNYGWDPDTYETIITYSINDEEVTEDEYNKHSKQQMTKFFGILVKAYKALTNAEKTKLENEVVDGLKAYDATLEAEAEVVVTYDGEVSTFANVITKLEALAALNFDTLTYAQVQEELDNALVIVMQFIGANAPYVHNEME